MNIQTAFAKITVWIVPSHLSNIAALCALLFATYMNWSWPWGLLFIYWMVPSILHGEAHLINPISRSTNPALFWIVAGLWMILGVLMILVDVAPEFVINFYTWMWGY